VIKQVFTSGGLPEYHHAMLVVKIKPTVGPVLAAAARSARRAPGAAATAAMAGPADALSTPGLLALSALERGGLIKRVTPVSRQTGAGVAALAPRRAMSALAMSAGGGRGRRVPDSNAGVNLVELERDADVDALQVALAKDPHVEFVSRVPVRYLVARGRSRARASAAGGKTAKAVPPAAATMWNLRKIGWANARALTGFKDANRINVAVLDTGIDAGHPDLKGRVASYVFAHPDTPDVSGERDIIGHGTHVAGTIAAVVNNRIGINGICNCRLRIWKIFDDETDFASFGEGFVYFVDPIMYLRALGDCLEENVDVVNLSIGGGGKPSHQEQQLFDALLANGTAVVAAMGNEREMGSPTSFPAAIPGVIAVGATSLDDFVTNFSNRGDHISLSAPGKGIWSTLPTYPGQFGFEAVPGPGGRPIEGKAHRRETGYDAWDGTSMASPHVAAAAALLTAKQGRLGPQETRRQLRAKADKVAGMHGASADPDYGAGRLNLLRLLS
jgi:subtilisin family serine protease